MLIIVIILDINSMDKYKILNVKELYEYVDSDMANSITQININNENMTETDLITVSKYVNLKILILIYNNIERLPDEICNLINLQTLIIYYNKIETLPEKITKLNKLNHLEITYSNIKKLQKEIYELENLRELVIYNNFIEEISSDIIKLRNLQTLFIGNLPSEEAEFDNYEINYNNIWNLPNEICALKLINLEIQDTLYNTADPIKIIHEKNMILKLKSDGIINKKIIPDKIENLNIMLPYYNSNCSMIEINNMLNSLSINVKILTISNINEKIELSNLPLDLIRLNLYIYPMCSKPYEHWIKHIDIDSVKKIKIPLNCELFLNDILL